MKDFGDVIRSVCKEGTNIGGFCLRSVVAQELAPPLEVEVETDMVFIGEVGYGLDRNGNGTIQSLFAGIEKRGSSLECMVLAVEETTRWGIDRDDNIGSYECAWYITLGNTARRLCTTAVWEKIREVWA